MIDGQIFFDLPIKIIKQCKINKNFMNIPCKWFLAGILLRKV